MTDTKYKPAVVRSSPHAWKWFLSVGLVSMAGLAAVGVLIVALSVKGGIAALTGSASGSKVGVIDTSNIKNVLKENKYVPLTVITTVEIDRSDSYKSWGIYWGTNVAKVRASNVRIQYMMDMGDLQTSDVSLDTSAVPARLTIYAPTPRVDEDMVAIDPTQIETSIDGGWMRWDKAKTLADAVNDLKGAAIKQARAGFNLVYYIRRHEHHGGALWTPIRKTCGSGLCGPVMKGR
ncbi:MAG TPA: hypothetical protein VHQ47_18310 [Phycisphaerae bacterium]|nr:hypothetical protein [Phycisphaerae bacterium]